MKQANQEHPVNFLSDMYSVEQQALAQLVSAPDIAGEPTLAENFRQHHQEQHADAADRNWQGRPRETQAIDSRECKSGTMAINFMAQMPGSEHQRLDRWGRKLRGIAGRILRCNFGSMAVSIGFIVGLISCPPNAAAESGENTVEKPARGFYGETTAEMFEKREDVRQAIDSEHFDAELLSAAIFHRTNAVRSEHDLAPLKYNAAVAAAAQKHATAMANGDYLSHGTPHKERNVSPFERLQNQQLRPKFSAENILFNFVLNYEAQKPFFVREENGRTVYSYEPGGEPLKPHTYAGFARTVVRQWMESPSHRVNVLTDRAEQLGVGCALSPNSSGFDQIYCDQDFFTPLPADALPSLSGDPAR